MRSPFRRLSSGVLAASLVLGTTAGASAIPPNRPASSAADGISPGPRSQSVEGFDTSPIRVIPDGGMPIERPTPRASSALHQKAVGRATIVRAGTATAEAFYRGRNHVWIPSLGISRGMGWYSCGASRPLGSGIYRWGCAGRNNIYLLAHAWAAFKPLHDAYVLGRLRKGMAVVHADARGRITTYRVRFWRVVSPVGASWAYAPQSRRSMTLQTCVGSRSQYRLVVRLTVG
jgi:hypothetical protein